jgi:hypothetical protein
MVQMISIAEDGTDDQYLSIAEEHHVVVLIIEYDGV